MKPTNLNNMASTPHSLRLSDEQKEKIRVAAAVVGLPFPDTIRKAIDFGLPVLVERLTKKVR